MGRAPAILSASIFGIAATLKADSAEVADVRRLDLSPRSFRTTVAGLFLFVPLLEGIDLSRVVRAGRLPGSKMIPAE